MIKKQSGKFEILPISTKFGVTLRLPVVISSGNVIINNKLNIINYIYDKQTQIQVSYQIEHIFGGALVSNFIHFEENIFRVY